MFSNPLSQEHETSFNRILRRIIFLPIGVMVFASLLLAWLVSHLLTVTNSVDHTDQVIAQAQTSERLIVGMETDMRGYLITGDRDLLPQFSRVGAEIGPELFMLSQLVSDNPPQVERVKTIRAAFGKWVSNAQDMIERRQRGADYQSIPINQPGKQLMEAMHHEFNRFNEVEETLRARRVKAVRNIDQNIRRFRWLLLVFLGVGIGLYVRRQLIKAVRLYDSLLATAHQNSAALRASEMSLRNAQRQLEQYAAELEQTVAQRTAKLQESVSQLEAYSYSVSHDLHAPLRAMQGYARVLVEDFEAQTSPQQRVYLDRIMASAYRMDKLIRDILSFSRITSAEIISEPVALEKLIRDLIQQYPALHSLPGEIKLEGPLPTVMAPEALLSQALSNLLNNAAKLIPDGTSALIRIWAETDGADVKLWIEDNGIGIAPEYQERIFGVFERLPLAPPRDGTGIGLAIVRKVIERMGGKVGVVSALGEGSKFWIFLPGKKLEVTERS